MNNVSIISCLSLISFVFFLSSSGGQVLFGRASCLGPASRGQRSLRRPFSGNVKQKLWVSLVRRFHVLCVPDVVVVMVISCYLQVSALRAVTPSPCTATLATTTTTTTTVAGSGAPTSSGSSKNSLRVGSAVTVAELVSALQPWADGGSVVYQGVVRHLMRVANTQVKVWNIKL